MDLTKPLAHAAMVADARPRLSEQSAPTLRSACAADLLDGVARLAVILWLALAETEKEQRLFGLHGLRGLWWGWSLVLLVIGQARFRKRSLSELPRRVLETGSNSPFQSTHVALPPLVGAESFPSL